MSDTARGALAMVLATAVFNFNDVIMKILLGDLPLGQAIFLRGVISILVGFAFLAAVTGFDRIRDLWHPAVLLRSAFVTATMVCFLSALPHVSIAVLTSMLQATPLIVTALAALFLKEPVGWRRWLATLIGLGGVLVIIDPFSEGGGLGVFALLGLATAVLNALRDLTTRAAPVTTPTLVIALSATMGGALLGGAMSLGETWAPVSPAQGGMIVIAAIGSMAGHYLVGRAMRLGEMSVVSPFRYAVVLWAMLWSWVIFADPPTAQTLIGVAIVVGAGLYMMARERALGRPRREVGGSPTAP